MFAWMKNIIIYLIISGLAINFTPGKEYKKYIRFYIGMLMILMLINPIMYIFNIDKSDIDRFLEQMNSYYEMDSFEDVDGIYNYYSMGIGESIEQELNKMGYIVEVNDILTDQYGDILKCSICVDDETVDKFFIKKYISDVYNIDVNNIYILKR